MEMFSNLVSFASLIIVIATLWAALSEKVKDGLPVKFSLALTSLCAYLSLTHQNERTLGMMVIAIGITCLTAGFQKFVLHDKLFHHKTRGKQCLSNFLQISALPNSPKAQRHRG